MGEQEATALSEDLVSRDKDAMHKSNEQSSTEAKDDNHLTGFSLYILLVSMLLLVFVITLDISVVATAVPRITDEFHTITDIGWYVSAFLISQCAVQPLAGRIFTFFPFKLGFLAFFGLFELGSVLCGAAQSSNMLIVGRAVCGMGSAGLVNGSVTIIGAAATPAKRPLYMGIFMSVAGCGQIIGPLIGGALTQHASWRWCFYINLPVGALTIAGFIFTKLPPINQGRAKTARTFKAIALGLDAPGFALFAPGCVMMLLALQWGGSKHPWDSAIIIGLLCGAGAIFVVFGFVENWQGENAMIPGSLLRVRVIVSSMITSFFQGAAMLIVTYYLSIWFQVIKHSSPTNAGVYLLPNFISQVFMSIIVGASLTKFGYLLPPMLMGNSLVSIGYGLLTTLTKSSGAGHWIGYQILGGFGRGTSLQMPLLAVQASVPISKMATVTGLVMWSQFFGGAIFLSVAQTIFVLQLRTSLGEHAPTLDASTIINAGATGFVNVVPKNLQPGVEEAYNFAITRTFYLGLAVAATSIVTALGVGTLKADMKKMKGMGAPKVEAEKAVT